MDLRISVILAAPRSRIRDGGKEPAARLLRPMKPQAKRAAFLRWFLDDASGRTVGATMANFGISRAGVFSFWTSIRRDHGIGYALSSNVITVLLPPGTRRDSIFGVPDGA